MTREIRTGPKSGDRQEWRTPRELARGLVARFEIDLDAAAKAETAIVPRYLGPGGLLEDARFPPWSHVGSRIFCNPPFSQFEAFAHQAIRAYEDGSCVVLLGPANPDTRWFHRLATAGAHLGIFRGRVRYEPPPGVEQAKHGPAFPSALFLLGFPELPRFSFTFWCPRTGRQL